MAQFSERKNDESFCFLLVGNRTNLVHNERVNRRLSGLFGESLSLETSFYREFRV